MSQLNLTNERSPSYRTESGALLNGRGTPDGLLYTAPFLLRQLLGGKLFSAQMGTAIVPATFQVAADLDRPAFTIEVAAGKAIIPVRLSATFQSGVLTPTVEMWTATANMATVAATAITAVNLDQASSDTSTCTVKSLHTTNMTAVPTTAQLIFAWTGVTANITGQIFCKWDWTEGNAPYITTPVGAAVAATHGLVVHCWAGTAATGFLQVAWLELNASDYPGA